MSAKIVARTSTQGFLLGFNYIYDGEIMGTLTSSDLLDFVDTDITVELDGKEYGINDYLGESRCFSARQVGHSF